MRTNVIIQMSFTCVGFRAFTAEKEAQFIVYYTHMIL